MSDFPIQAVLVPMLGLAVVIVMVLYRRRALTAQETQYAQYRVGELASRLGLQIVQGDPTFNLFIQYANVDMRRGPSDGRPVHIEVRLEGAPRGVPLELYYLYRVEQESGFTGVTWRTWFEGRMSATAKQAFPPFEVISRSPPLGPIATIQALPPASTGDPAVDSEYQVSTNEPAMAKLLGEVLPAFSTFRNSGIHLVGDGQRVSFHMRRDKAPLLANALYFAEEMADRLSDLARRVGG